jgi:hypothetical protein
MNRPAEVVVYPITACDSTKRSEGQQIDAIRNFYDDCKSAGEAAAAYLQMSDIGRDGRQAMKKRIRWIISMTAIGGCC